ncbi:MAG: hypothetical protein AAF558_04715 [Verrucomicrobiota bacterium]
MNKTLATALLVLMFLALCNGFFRGSSLPDHPIEQSIHLAGNSDFWITEKDIYWVYPAQGPPQFAYSIQQNRKLIPTEIESLDSQSPRKGYLVDISYQELLAAANGFAVSTAASSGSEEAVSRKRPWLARINFTIMSIIGSNTGNLLGYSLWKQPLTQDAEENLSNPAFLLKTMSQQLTYNTIVALSNIPANSESEIKTDLIAQLRSSAQATTESAFPADFVKQSVVALLKARKEGYLQAPASKYICHFLFFIVLPALLFYMSLVSVTNINQSLGRLRSRLLGKK